MPPRFYSRHTFTNASKDDSDRLVLSEREPFRFKAYADTRTHVVKEGDTLHSLSARYFASFKRPAGLWWVIADFQPTPIFDPTIALVPNDILLIPSERVVNEHIFSEERRKQESE